MENRYDKYKDSGIAWIGEIPEHWEVKRMKSIYNFGKGLNITKADLVDKGIPVISYGQIHSKINTGTCIKDSLIKYVPEIFFENNNTSLVKKGDIIFADTSEDLEGCGNCIYIDRDMLLYAGYHTIIAKNISTYINKYFSYLFQTDCWRTQIRRTVNGVKLFSIPQRLLASTDIITPSTQEQQSIATYLDQKCSEIDELITLQEKMITKLQSYKQSVITEAVTKGLDKNVPLKDSGIEWIGEIPEHWEVKRLKNVCSTNNASLSDKTSKEFEFDYVDIGSVSFELGIHKTEKYTFQNAPSRARKIARLGDIIVSTVRTYLRAIDIINSEEKVKYIYSTGFAILSPLKNILSEFMIYICRSEYFTNQVSIYSTGINYPSINDTALKMINIVMPPLPEQQSIATYLDQKCSEIDELISIKQQKIEKLKDYKKSLIFECVTGKRKV